jgi:hypothetical protein
MTGKVITSEVTRTEILADLHRVIRAIVMAVFMNIYGHGWAEFITLG